MAALVLLLSLQGCSLLPATAAETGVPSWQPTLAALAAQTLEEYHYHPPQLDDATSREWLDRYIDSLDYDHKVFLASDVDEFRTKYAKRLDDDVQGKSPNLDAAFDIWNRYRERLRARVTDAVAMIHEPQDYTVKESLPIERDKAPFPATEAEARELWRLRTKYDLLQGELKGEDHAKYVALLTGMSEARLLSDMTRQDPRNPVRPNALDMLRPPNLADLRPEWHNAYTDAYRRRAMQVIWKLTTQAGDGAIGKVIAAMKQTPPADGAALAQTVKQATGVDLTKDLGPQ